MGILDGYENLTQQDFLGEAANANNNGNSQTGSQEPQPPAEVVATTIAWQDSGDRTDSGDQAGGTDGANVDAAAQNSASSSDLSFNSNGTQTSGIGAETVPTDYDIAASDKTTVKQEVIKAGGDEDLAEEIGKVVGPAKGVESYLANLNKQIDEQRNKRKKARLLAFGLALLGGEGMATAVRAANQTPFFDDEDLNQMLDQRKDLMSGLHTSYLESQGIWTPAVQDMQDGKLSVAKKTADILKIKASIGGNGWNTTDLKEGQAKALALGNELITGVSELKAIEDNNPNFNPKSIRSSFEAALATDTEGNITGLKAAVLDKLNPKLAAYLRSTLKVITAKLRKESGAAIGASEWSTELNKIVPAGPKEFKAAQANRERMIQGLVTSSGAPSKEAFYKAVGFSGVEYNADEWYADLLGSTDVATITTPTGGVVDLDSLLGG